MKAFEIITNWQRSLIGERRKCIFNIMDGFYERENECNELSLDITPLSFLYGIIKHILFVVYRRPYILKQSSTLDTDPHK